MFSKLALELRKVVVPCFGRQNRFELLEDKSTEFSDHNLHNNVAQNLCSTIENMTPTTSQGSDDHVELTNLLVVGNIHRGKKLGKHV